MLFITGDGIVGFIEKIEALGRHAGIFLEVRSVDVVKAGGDALVLKFNTNGEWESTLYFLGLVESLPERIEIENVNLRNIVRAEEGKTTAVWSGDFTISLLSFFES